MGFVWTVSIIWGLALSVLAPFFPKGYSLLVLLVAWAPTALLGWMAMNKSGNRQKAHAAMLEAAGVAAGSGMEHAEAGTGIALNKAAKTLTLLIDGVHKTYPFSEVREWESRKERAGQVVGVGVRGSVAAVGATARAERDASANTGLFITVRDVDRPSWRIAMKDEGMQARWMEILRQEINEH